VVDPAAPSTPTRRTLRTGAGLLTDKRQARLDAVLASEEHVEVGLRPRFR